MKGLFGLASVILAILDVANGRVKDKTKNTVGVGFMYADYNDTMLGGLQDQMTTMEIGARMAMEEINANPTMMMDAKLVPRRENSQNIGGGSQAGTYRLHEKGSKLIFSDPDDENNYYSGCVSEFLNVPHVCMDCVSADVGAYRTFIRMTSVAYITGIIQTVKAMGWKNVGVVYTIDSFSVLALQELKKNEWVTSGNLTLITTQAIQLAGDAKRSNVLAMTQLNPVFDMLKASHTRVLYFWQIKN